MLSVEAEVCRQPGLRDLGKWLCLRSGDLET
jgi:hypothetical protein